MMYSLTTLVHQGKEDLMKILTALSEKICLKSTDLSKNSPIKIKQITNQWNSIPRKSLGCSTPKEILKMATEEDEFLPIA